MGCSSLSTVPTYNSPNVTTWYMAYGGCKKLTHVPDCDYSNTKTTTLMFVDGGITEIPTDLMQRFPKLTGMSNMFHGCPLGGDLKLTLGSDYINSDSSLTLSGWWFLFDKCL